MPKLYQFGGESMYFAGRYNGYSMPSYRAAEDRALGNYYPTALSPNGGVSLLSTGPEGTQLNDGPLSGILSLSDNEKTLAIVAGVAVAGFVGWEIWRSRKR